MVGLSPDRSLCLRHGLRFSLRSGRSRRTSDNGAGTDIVHGTNIRVTELVRLDPDRPFADGFGARLMVFSCLSHVVPSSENAA